METKQKEISLTALQNAEIIIAISVLTESKDFENLKKVVYDALKNQTPLPSVEGTQIHNLLTGLEGLQEKLSDK